MLYLYSNSGEFLFSGSRREIKMYIRANKISNYFIRAGGPKKKEPYEPPPIVIDPPIKPVPGDPIIIDPPTDPIVVEGLEEELK